jgi:hypothetical protein
MDIRWILTFNSRECSLSLNIFRALGLRDDFTDFTDACAGVHGSLSAHAAAVEGAHVGESSSRRSGGGHALAFHSTVESDEVLRLDDLGHSGGHDVGNGTLSTERRRFLKFSELALIFLFLADKPSLSVLEGSLLGLLREYLIHELDGVRVSQVIVQFSTGLHDMCLVWVGDVGDLIFTIMSHRSAEYIFAFTSVILLVSESSGRRVMSVVAVEVSHHFVEAISVLVGFPEFTILGLLSGVHQSLELGLELSGLLFHLGVTVGRVA